MTVGGKSGIIPFKLLEWLYVILKLEEIVMEDNVLVPSNLTVTTEEAQTLGDYLAEMLRLRSEIDAEQVEIERLKADNRELKAETRAMLTTLKATLLT